MKSTYKLILYSIIIFVISTIGITYWYVSDHLLSDMSAMPMKSLMNISIYIGLVGALIPTFSFLIIYFLTRKIKNKWLLSLVLIILFAVVLAIVYWFVLCAIFQDHDNPQSFISRFLGL
ncbi:MULTISPECIES: hypothetical protein [unclassified Flavobacterium]|jgi:prepilin signal peptidase PulO-like enzyme (type II secretory pathway)|uniref:hypothetical protein n=1 Tax=unclassified Flavobacterium TaxID=196869 RepID=UPI00057F1B43|nr:MULTISPECIES: hypothetical protein [unclassified Flavobacterium]KIA97021.1 hypothetical protein OA93_15610 [Flavobacterium sp. KMS]MEA9414056.1 hypothetical protein [Flavobacterium sp. PL02]